MQRDSSIDLLKGIAIWGIIICHASSVIDGVNATVYQICRLGQLGCQFFFFFTGYLMFFSKTEKKPYFKYMGDKIKGIIIPWYIMIFLYVVIMLLVDLMNMECSYETNTNWIAIIVNCLFLNGIIPFANNNVVLGGWYIGTLVIIWAIFPLISWFYKKLGIKILYIGIFSCVFIMVLMGILLGQSYIARNGFMYFSFVNQLPCVLYGMIYACNEKKGGHSVKSDVLRLCLLIPSLFVLFYMDIPFNAVIYPVVMCKIVGIIWRITKSFYREDNKGAIAKYLVSSGRNSLYLYLTHVIVVWYIQDIIWKLFLKPNTIDPTLAFFVLGLLWFFVVPLFAKLLKIVVAMLSNTISKKI